jgi:hypothetical protein
VLSSCITDSTETLRNLNIAVVLLDIASAVPWGGSGGGGGGGGGGSGGGGGGGGGGSVLASLIQQKNYII